MNVFRIEYLIDKEETTWKASILAKDQKDAISFLTTYINKPCKINYISNNGEVHAITDTIKKVFSVEKEVEVIKEVEVEKEIEVELYKCPYCDKTFKTGKTLLAHMKKFHSEEE